MQSFFPPLSRLDESIDRFPLPIFFFFVWMQGQHCFQYDFLLSIVWISFLFIESESMRRNKQYKKIAHKDDKHRGYSFEIIHLLFVEASLFLCNIYKERIHLQLSIECDNDRVKWVPEEEEFQGDPRTQQAVRDTDTSARTLNQPNHTSETKDSHRENIRMKKRNNRTHRDLDAASTPLLLLKNEQKMKNAS